MDGPDIVTCKGCSGISHPFLVAEGTYTCESCQACVCQFCYMSKALDDELLEGGTLLCFDCIRASILDLTDGKDEA
jgi:hypothetical protein